MFFIRERMIRLGLPFFFVLIFVMLLGYYAACMFSGGYPNYLAY